MNRFYPRFRIFLLMFSLGLASVPFFNELYVKWSESPVELPQISFETPIYVRPKLAHEIPTLLPISKADLDAENDTDQKFACIYSFDINQPRYISVLQNPEFEQLPAALKELIAEKATHSKNTFYVAKIDTENGNSTDVYWKEENVLILLEPPTYDWKYALVWSRRYWDFKKDVVPTLNDVKGSSFLLTKANWRKLVSNCEHGDKFTINRNE